MYLLFYAVPGVSSLVGDTVTHIIDVLFEGKDFSDFDGGQIFSNALYDTLWGFFGPGKIFAKQLKKIYSKFTIDKTMKYTMQNGGSQKRNSTNSNMDLGVATFFLFWTRLPFKSLIS